MTDIPKLKHEHSTFLSSSVICCKDSDYLTEAQATEIIRQVEERPQIIKLLTYFYNLPSNGSENHEEHQAKLELAKPYIEEAP